MLRAGYPYLRTWPLHALPPFGFGAILERCLSLSVPASFVVRLSVLAVPVVCPLSRGPRPSH